MLLAQIAMLWAVLVLLIAFKKQQEGPEPFLPAYYGLSALLLLIAAGLIVPIALLAVLLAPILLGR